MYCYCWAADSQAQASTTAAATAQPTFLKKKNFSFFISISAVLNVSPRLSRSVIVVITQSGTTAE